jgi:hypothetical protein
MLTEYFHYYLCCCGSGGMEFFMKKDFLKCSYYLEDGKLDNFLIVHPNCFFKCVYLVIKATIGIDFDPYDLFLEDITQTITLLPQNKLLFHLAEYTDYHENTNFSKFISINRMNFHNDNNALSIVEKCLDEGNIVLIATVSEKLPFLNFYDPDYTYDKWLPGHVMPIVGHDSKYLFYVDEERLLNNNHKIHPDNSEVGMIEKDFIGKILSEHLHCCTLTFDKDVLAHGNRNIVPIKASIENYYKSDKEISDFRDKEISNLVSFGQNALNKVISACSDNNISYTIENFSFTDPSDFLRIAIGRRKILKIWLSNYIGISEIHEIVDENIEGLEKLRSACLKRFFRNRSYILHKELKENFENFLQIENKLIHSLKGIIKEDKSEFPCTVL